MHPVMAAKQAMTIDHVTGGRFNLNVVTGWYRPEIEMFGEPQLEHDKRYDRAIEWLDVIKLLWTREEEFDYEGSSTRSRRAGCAEAGAEAVSGGDECGRSDKGRHYAAKYCDVAFTSGVAQARGREGACRALSRLRARNTAARSVRTNAYIVQGETEEDAKKFFNYYVHEKGDWVAVDNLTTTLGINAQTMPPDVAHQLKAHFIAGWAGYPIVGTKEQVVDELATLSRAGFDGAILSWAELSSRCESSSRSRIRWWCRRACDRTQGFTRTRPQDGHAPVRDLQRRTPRPGTGRALLRLWSRKAHSRSARNTLL